MKRLRHSAAYRIAFVYAAASVLTMLLVGTIVVLVAHSAFTRQLDRQILEDSKGIVAEYREAGSNAVVAAIAVRESGNSANALLYALFARDGRRIAGSLQTTRPALGWSDIAFHDPLEGNDSARSWAVDLPDGTRLLVAADNSLIGRVDGLLIILFGGAFVAILLLSLIGALLLGRYLQRRLSSISIIAGEIVAGDMSRRIATGQRNDEFDQLAGSLNGMLERIEGLMINLRQISGDIAHDLRTPLARLRNHLEQGLENPARSHETLESALAQADQLLRLFAAILRITEIEGGARRRAFARFDLSALAQELYESYQPAVEDAGRSMGQAIRPGIIVHGDRELIAQAIINLLDNAQIHTPPGTHIELALGRGADGIALMVADDGPGVPFADHGHIMRRFSRLERSRSTPGHGLGLSLVQAVMLAHDGQVRLGSEDQGLRVTLLFPAG